MACFWEDVEVRGEINGRDARCPFYKCHTKNVIVCEGPIPESNVHNVMRQEGRRLHYRTFCCRKWENCEIARANEWKYEEE